MRRQRRVSLAALGIVLVLGGGVAHGEDSEAVRQLLENAAYWKQRGRADKLAEVYEKILRSDPGHAEALAELALFAAHDGRKEEAQGYLSRLARAHPADPRLPGIRRALDVGGSYRDLLARARRLAGEGRTAEALAAYRQAFGGAVPSGEAALEYYQTVGGAEDGWREARDGLERLHRLDPRNDRVALAYAQHLTYREGTRREGIRRLSGMARSGELAAEARRSWRQALAWLNADGHDAGLYRDFLAVAGEDAELRAKLERLGRTGGATAVASGYRALESADVAKADEAFRWALQQRGRNVDALVGLALVELERQDFAAAEQLLDEARRLAPDQPEKWERSLQSARFWRRVREAEVAQEQREFERAASLLAEAADASPEDAIHARMALGNLHLAMGQRERAAERFAGVLEVQPDHQGALLAMVHLMLENGQAEAAEVFNERLRALDPEQGFTRERMRSEVLRHQARLELDVGDVPRATRVLEEARNVDPGNEWALFDLVNAWLEHGEVAKARGALEQLVAAEHPVPHLPLLQARLLAEEGRFVEAVGLIDGTRERELGPEAEALRDRIEIGIQAQMAVRKGLIDGDAAGARRDLAELQARTSAPELLGMVALAWSDLGDPTRALAVARSALARSGDRSATVRLQMAAIQLRSGDVEGLSATLTDLRRDGTLTPRERAGLTSLRIAWAIHQADLAREQGELTTAFEVLRPMLEEFEEDPRLVNALGRVLYTAGDHPGAAAVFERVLVDHPADLDARHGAILTAVATGRRDRAELLLQEGLAARPDDPRAHLVAGRVHVLLGRDARAIRAFRQALELEERQRGGVEVPMAVLHARSRRAGAVDHESSYRDLVKASAMRLAAGNAPEHDQAGAREASLRSEILREMDRVQARYRYEVGAEVNIRRRMGEAGLSGLTELRVPVFVRIPTGYTGRFELHAAPVYLDAGHLDLTNPDVYERFGTLAVGGTSSGAPEATATGAELSAAWSWQGYRVWLGSTPLGFPRPTVTGGFRAGGQVERFGFAFTGERNPVTDSVLSYAGLTDPSSGELWGAVTRNGGRLDLAYDDRRFLLYGFGGYAFVHGVNVLPNHRWEGGLGLRWTLVDREAVRWSTGLAAMGMGFTENQRFFTFGHGGYFSPQLFVNAGVPLLLDGKTRRVRYGLDATLGVNWFREDAASLYAGFGGWDAAARDLLDADETPVTSQYGDRRVLSFALNATGRVAYRVNDHLEPGLLFSVQTAAAYTEVLVGFQLGYTFGSGAPEAVAGLRPLPY